MIDARYVLLCVRTRGRTTKLPPDHDARRSGRALVRVGTPADWAVNFVASVPDTKDLEGVFASRHRAYLDDAAVLPATLVHQHVARFAGVVSKTSSGPYGVMRKKW